MLHQDTSPVSGWINYDVFLWYLLDRKYLGSQYEGGEEIISRLKEVPHVSLHACYS